MKRSRLCFKPSNNSEACLAMATFVNDAIRAFTELGMQDESSLPILKSLQDRHNEVFPVMPGTNRYYFKVECPDDAMTMHASKILDTSVIDKASFAAMTAELEEVTYKDQWTKDDNNCLSYLEMQVVVIDIGIAAGMALQSNRHPFPMGSKDRRLHLEYIPKTPNRP